jgi:hypothetical protein
MNLSRVILCRPQGGLNDVLCQIERVCRYAEQFDRTVIVDTNQRSTRAIKDDFSRYFVSTQQRVLLGLTNVRFEPKNVGVVPHFLAGNFFDYDAYYDNDHENYAEKNTRQLITFDFTRDYAEPILIHHACGRIHGASVAALSRLRLQDSLCSELAKRLNLVGQNYDAVHIRNTDYKTNYPHFLEQLKGQAALADCERLFVATDDIACLEYCRNFFRDIKIFSFSRLPQESGRPVHWLSETDDNYERNKDAILDLLMLALSRKFIFFEINDAKYGTKYSGFSILARDLRNSKSILDQLLSAHKTPIGTASHAG